MEELVGDRRIRRERKGNVLSSCTCYHGIYQCTRDDDTNRETTGESPGLHKQPGKNNRELRELIRENR